MFEVVGVSAGYSGTPVLRGVNLRVPAGAVVGLLGANGAGKTTLLRVAAGLLRPTSGHVRLDGNDVTRDAPHVRVRRGICLIPEGRGVFPALSVRDNLALQAPGSAEDAVAEAVDIFPVLGQRLSQPSGTLSGGEQQMLALSRAYLQRPQVVLLDEVSMGLAPKIIDEIFDFLRLLARQGSSLLLVEQYVERALDAADYVYLLRRGEIAFVGEPGELRDEVVFAHYSGAAATGARR